MGGTETEVDASQGVGGGRDGLSLFNPLRSDGHASLITSIVIKDDSS